ncbi:hypothetical protein PYW07_015137 [Mythimna separata]|uniref:Serpin domain-containing protein n=1 Tax=Mythimna separata TaxID=271217 RepID=A0AAD7Z0A6_MYTSE|nr:hypothetical protein PYW07_015137 [Mythimna separata]
MKVFFIFIYLCFIVSAKRHKYSFEYASTSDSASDSSEDKEVLPFTDGYFDTRGGIRKYFALEAALVDHGRNVICSPIAALMPLGKLLIGAKSKGKAEQELLDALGLKRSIQLKNAFALLVTNMLYLQGVTLDVASRIFVSTESKVNETFDRIATKLFKTSVRKIDVFNPRETAQQINDWVADKTRNKITKLISSSDISKDVSLIAVNAIYFAGKWKDEFDKSYTGDFHSPTGTRRIPMMSHSGKYKYWKCDVINAEVIEIPYKGSQSSMVIVLPFSNTGLTALLRTLKLSSNLLNDALEKMKYSNVLLSMPKFKIESELDLRYLYQKIGLHSIFNPVKSGLTEIIEDEEVFVSKAIHKAVIEVNEKGTKAAAVSGLVLQLASASLNQPIFRADRPFLFYVNIYREQLFSGVFSG